MYSYFFFFDFVSRKCITKEKPAKIQKEREWMVQDTPENMAAL